LEKSSGKEENLALILRPNMAQEGWSIVSAHNYINIQGAPLTRGKKGQHSFKVCGFTPACYR